MNLIKNNLKFFKKLDLIRGFSTTSVKLEVIQNTNLNSEKLDRYNVPIKKRFNFEVNQEGPFKALQTLNPKVLVLVLDPFDLTYSVPADLCNPSRIGNSTKILVVINHLSSLSKISLKLDFQKWVLSILRKKGLVCHSKVQFVDGNSGQNLDSLVEQIERFSDKGDSIGFMGFPSANVNSLIDNIHKDIAFETNRYSIPNPDGTIFRGYSYRIIDQSNANLEKIKFKMLTIPLLKPRQSLLNLLTPYQRRLFVPPSAHSPLEGSLYKLKPNMTLIFKNFLRIDYKGEVPIFFNNFTKFYPKFVRTSELKDKVENNKATNEENEVKEKLLILGKKPVNFPNITHHKKIKLPLIMNDSSINPKKFNFDITLNGLGWISFNTKYLEIFKKEGLLTVYGLNGFNYPITATRLPSWNVENVKLFSKKKSLESDNINEEILSTKKDV